MDYVENVLETLPAGWVKTTLTNLLLDPKSNIVDGPFGSNLKASEYKAEGIPILRIQNIERHAFIPKNIKFVNSLKAGQLKRHSYSAGDIIITKLGDPLGKACIMPEGIQDGIIVADLVRLRLDHDFLDKRWLSYTINAQDVSAQLKTLTKGTTRPRVNLTHIRELRLYVPPLNEQRRIVAKIEELFSELDKGIESLKAAREQLKVYRQAVLKHAFEGKLTADWREENKDTLETADELLAAIPLEREKKLDEPTADEVKQLSPLPEGWKYARLGCFIENISAGKSFKCDEREPEQDEVGVAKVSAVTWGEYNEAESKTCLDPEKINPSYFIEPGDFLFSRANTIELVGACVIAKTVTKRVMLSDKTLRINFKNITPLYFLYYLRSQNGRNEIMKRSTGNQESMRNIGQERIKSIVVPICSPEEASQIYDVIQERFSILDNFEKRVST